MRAPLPLEGSPPTPVPGPSTSEREGRLDLEALAGDPEGDALLFCCHSTSASSSSMSVERRSIDLEGLRDAMWGLGSRTAQRFSSEIPA